MGIPIRVWAIPVWGIRVWAIPVWGSPYGHGPYPYGDPHTGMTHTRMWIPMRRYGSYLILIPHTASPIHYLPSILISLSTY
eukprot:g42437.t1